MALPLYLARTEAEMGGKESFPDRLAYLALHFSPDGTGLLRTAPELPPGAMLILDDSIPMGENVPEIIANQLLALVEKCRSESLLLDFQRPDIQAQQELASLLCSALPCPVAVSELYAKALSCPVFLSPVPPDRPLAEYLGSWRGRAIWLDAALDGIILTLTESGCTCASLPDFPETGLRDEKLHCHYKAEAPATFRLWRTREDLEELLKEAEHLGVAKAVGLWQELRK